MKSLKQEEFVPLKCNLEELLDFICELEVREVPYFQRYLERMRDNIELCILVQYESWEKLELILRRDWKEANHKIIGIPDFRICDESMAKKEVLDFRFIELIATIESYFFPRNESSM